MGTAAFALPVLAAVLDAGHVVACVYTQPPRAAGRGLRPRASPVQDAAERHGLPVRSPSSLKDPSEQAAFGAIGADAAVVAAYGLLLPPPVLEAPRLGCLNVHPSLLPRWRGAAPVARTIEAGDALTGVTIMLMDAGLDTGPVLLQREVPVPARARTGPFEADLAALGGRLMVAALAGLDEGSLVPQPQAAAGITYAPKLGRAEGLIDWRLPAAALEQRIRAFDPWPGSHATVGAVGLKVLDALVTDGDGAPGTLLDDRFTVACGSGALRLDRVRRAGRAATSGPDFLRGARLAVGTVLG